MAASGVTTTEPWPSTTIEFVNESPSRIVTDAIANATVALVSSGPLGGDCTFYGCVPSKTLIESPAKASTSLPPPGGSTPPSNT